MLSIDCTVKYCEYFRRYSMFALTNQVLHVVFVCLPLAWALGLLPPLDAVFLWLLEQALLVLFGGSPMASDLGSVCQFVSSCIAIVDVLTI